MEKHIIFPETHFEWAQKYGAKEPMDLLRAGWIRQRGPNFEAVGPLSSKTKDIIFMRSKDFKYDKIWVDVKDKYGNFLWKYQLEGQPPEALYESINKPLRSQAICDDIHFAVITSSGGEYGYGVFSWHTDEFSAKYNAKVTGGYVVPVEQDEDGCAELPKIHVVNALRQYFGDDYDNEPPKPELRIVKESLVEMVMPREIDKSKIYYHGTKDKNNALKIAKEGLKPQDIEFLEKKYIVPDNDEAGQEVDKQYMSISGRVYLTQDLFSAIQYASPGSGFELKGNQAKGYVVVINGNKIEDIEPDEDDVGSIILNIGNYVRSPRQFPLSFKIRAKYLIELHKIAIKYLGEKYWEKFFNEPQVGKIILPHLSDELKHVIIDIGGKIAHVGPIGVDEVWEFDIKDYYNLYSQDKKSRRSTIDEFVNNFFSKYARRIK